MGTTRNEPRQNSALSLTEALYLVVDVIVLILQLSYALVLSVKNMVLPHEPKSVLGEIVLITGGGHGIGKELAFLYASEGATVIIWDINEKTGSQTVKEITAKGFTKAYFFTCDVSKRDDVLKVTKQVQEQIGNVTILINNAGIMYTRPLLEHTNDEIQKMIHINVLAHFWILEAFLPSMQKYNHGHVVALSSLAGLFAGANVVPYCCSKYAVRGMMEALYHEFRYKKGNNIKFTTICPYVVDTGLVKNPKIRFQNVMKIMEPQRVAKEIINAQRMELREVTIPRCWYYLHKLYPLLPLKAANYVYDFIGLAAEPDSI